MKELINKRPKLYWTIVVGLALFVYALVSVIGLAKVRRADAAEENLFVVPWGTNTVEITNEGYEYYVILLDCSSDVAGHTRIIFSDEPLKAEFNGAKTVVSFTSKAGDLECILYGFNKAPNTGDLLGSRMLSVLKPNSGYGTSWSGSYYSNYAFADVPANLYVPPIEYLLSAPYVSFEKLDVVNPFRDGTAKYKLFVDIYEEYLSKCRWTYYGLLNNLAPDIDLGYSVDVELQIELPSERYMTENVLADDMTLEKLLKHSSALISVWDAYDGDIYDDKAEVYTIELTLPVEPNEVGIFEMGFTYQELEYLLHMDDSFHARWVELMGADDYDSMAFILAHMNVAVVKMNVKTTREDAIYMGKGAINIFHRGEYGACVEISPDVDYSTMTEEEIDALIKDAVQKATDDYYAELENRVEDLQGQLDNINGALGSFDVEYDGTSLWGAIRSVGSGLLGMTGFLTAFAGVIGGFFGFLPYDMRAVIGYLVIVGVFVVLWRLAKGK